MEQSQKNIASNKDIIKIESDQSKKIPDEQYCQQHIIDKVKCSIEEANKIGDNIGECVVCLENTKLIYIMCKHKICSECYSNLYPSISNKKKLCPMCRTEIKKIDYCKQYAILCLAKKTDKCMAENGGYVSVELLFYPPLLNTSKKIFNNILFYDDNPSKIDFIATILEIINVGYKLVYSDEKKIKRWLHDVRIDYFNELPFKIF